MEEIIIQKSEKEILVCVLENGEIVEKYAFELGKESTIGNIYIGTVKDIFDGMQAAFIDLGLEKKGFLSLKDAMPKIDMVKDEFTNYDNSLKLSGILEKNQNVLLQIRKEAYEDKGPRVSTHITLAGDYLVLMPETDIVTISQKIEEKTEKDRLLKIIKSILPERFGCIVRTDAVGLSEDELSSDMKKILNLWNEIQQKFEKNKKLESLEERLLYDDNSIIKKIARDMVKKATRKIYINDESLSNELKKCLEQSWNLNNNELVIFEANKNFIKDFGLLSEFEKIDNRKVWLKCGAHIVIDKAEALTAVDVNSSRCIGNENLEKTVFKVNKEAAVEIMKQLRLKDIGGIIVVDFIDMQNQEYKDEILRIMREEQKKDRSRIEVKDFTALNLVEITRKKLYV